MKNEKWKISPFSYCACRLLLPLSILLACCSPGAIAQIADDNEVAVTIIDKIDSGHLGSGYCLRWPDEPGPVIDEETFRKLLASESPNESRRSKDRCAFLKRLKVDFSKHSVLTYRVQGDCFVRARAKVTSNDNTRKYTLRITKIYGGCRAAGSFEGWLVIDTLLPDYKVEVVVFSER